MTEPVPNIDQDVRAAWNSTAPADQWIVEIAEDYVIVTDEKDRSFRRVPVLVGDSIEFGQPVPVMPGFVEVVAASAPVHRVVFASRAESRPDVAAAVATVLDNPPPDPRPPTEPATPAGPPPTEEEPAPTPPDEGGVPGFDPSTPGAEPAEHNTNSETEEDPVSTLSADVRSRLGLPDDADEAAALAAIDALKAQAEKPAEPSPELVAASAAKDHENEQLRAEVKVLASTMEQVTAELAAAKAKEAAVVKASVLDDAAKQGKFAPADRDRWAEDYDAAPAVVTRVLASIAPGTAVPVAAAGYTGTGDEATNPDGLSEDDINAWAKQLGIDAEELTRG
jgi:hypothetical protein